MEVIFHVIHLPVSRVYIVNSFLYVCLWGHDLAGGQ